MNTSRDAISRALERVRHAVAALFYVVWTVIGVGLIGLAVLWVADPPDDPLWTVEPTPAISYDPDGMGDPAPNN